MKQIVMVTDGKPTAAFIEPSNAAYFSYRRYSSAVPGEKRLLYKNSMGNDPFVMAETFKEVQACRKSGVMINTFMLASDHYLVDFVKTDDRDDPRQSLFRQPQQPHTIRPDGFSQTPDKPCSVNGAIVPSGVWEGSYIFGTAIVFLKRKP